MKRILLFLFPVFCCAAGFAQTNVQVRDSVYVYGGTADTTLDDLIYYQYDSACRLSASQTKLVYGSANDTVNFEQTLYGYNAAGNLTQNTIQYWSGSMYINNARTTNTFDANNHVTSTLGETWTDSSYWQPQYFDTTTYDNAENVVNGIYQSWNADSMKLLNKYESIIGFNSQEKDTAFTSLNWSDSLQTWIPANRTLSYYDTSGLLVKTDFQAWNASAVTWQTTSETTFYNNVKGQTDSSVQTSVPDASLVNKTYYVYDPVTSSQKQVTTYYYASGQLLRANRNVYYHFSSDKLYVDTSLFENLSADTFKIAFEFAYKLVLNDDATIKQNIFSENWDDGNVPFVTDNRYAYAPCQSSVLPVSLLSFTGKQQNKDALLQWQTTNEVNTSYFTLQRSVDGIHFTPVGKVMAAGNSFGVKGYTYTDANVALLQVSKLYYRLASTDRDGSVSYSQTIRLSIAAGKLVVYASPNPVSDVLQLYSSVSLPGAVIKIWDMSGRLLYASQQNVTAGNKVPVDVSALAKGMYVVMVQSAAEKYECRIVK